MGNKVAIDVGKFGDIRWKRSSEAFHGEKYISRKPYGAFKVTFDVSTKSVCTSVTISSTDYPQLNWAQMCVNYEVAVEKVAARFGQMDELIKKLEERNEVIKRYCCGLMNEAIRAAQALDGKLEDERQ